MMNVFDFDGTIYDGDCVRDLHKFVLKRKRSIVIYMPKQAFGFILHKLHIIDLTGMKSYLHSFIRKVDEKMLEEFWDENQSKIKQWYLDMKRDDDIIISSSPEYVLAPICRRLNVELIGSIIDTRTGRFIGLTCRDEEKVRRLREQKGDVHIEKFFSDSDADLPLAKLAEEAYFVTGNKVKRWDLPE